MKRSILIPTRPHLTRWQRVTRSPITSCVLCFTLGMVVTWNVCAVLHPEQEARARREAQNATVEAVLRTPDPFPRVVARDGDQIWF
jgi:hypothetical protein